MTTIITQPSVTKIIRQPSVTKIVRGNRLIHGVQPGGNLHAVATPALAGFMSAADKAALDAIVAGNVTSVFTRTGDVVAVAGDYAASLVTNDSGVAGAFVSDALDQLDGDIGTVSGALATHVGDTGNPHGVTLAQIGAAAAALVLTAGAGLTGGGDLSTDRTFDVGAHADGSIVVNADDIQVGVLATDAQHGDRGGGTQHAVAVPSGAAGFMSGADKAILDGLAASDGWHTFVAQVANPGTANTLWQEDGTSYTAGTLVWADLSLPLLLSPNVSLGDPGFEQGGINIGGVTYNAELKLNDIGGTRPAQLVVHRHSATLGPIAVFARSQGDTASHVDVVDSDLLMQIVGAGWNGANYKVGATISARVQGAPGASDMPTRLIFSTTPAGSSSEVAAVQITSSQDLDLLGHSIINPNLIDGRDVSADGAVLDAHVVNTSNPHSVTAAQAGADPVGTAAAAVAAHVAALDPHAQYLLLAGRAGGQSAFGGTAAADHLTLQANTVSTGAGRIQANSPIVFGPYSGTTAQYGFDYSATESFGSPFIGGGLNFSGSITFTSGTFIYESFRGAPTINTGANPGFAAYTVLQALPLLNAGSGGGHNPLNPLIVNAGPVLQNTFAGTRTSTSSFGMNHAPQTRASGAGVTMTVGEQTAVNMQATYSTSTASSVANLGTIRGLHVKDPVGALFQPTLGIETLTALYAVDVNAITFGGNVPKVALRSAITPASNSYFIWNTGGGPPWVEAEVEAARPDFDNLRAGFDMTVSGADIEFGGTVRGPVVNGYDAVGCYLYEWLIAQGYYAGAVV